MSWPKNKKFNFKKKQEEPAQILKSRNETRAVRQSGYTGNSCG